MYISSKTLSFSLTCWMFYLATVNRPKIEFINYTLWKLEFFICRLANSLSFLFLNNLFLLQFVTLNYFNRLNVAILSAFIKEKKFFSIKLQELELKGVNYRFTKLLNTLLLDLGCSHFQLFLYSIKNFFISLKKKKLKKILFINFNKFIFSNTVNYYWYNLKSVGPYKLKGFQFINEWIKLKEGKKPFK